jgi:pimeloyl-ACP methyl ester carboxylesterase
LGGSTALAFAKRGRFYGLCGVICILTNRLVSVIAMIGRMVCSACAKMSYLASYIALRDVLAAYILNIPPSMSYQHRLRQQSSVILAEVLALMTGRELLKPVFRQMLNRPSLSRFLPLTQLQDCVSYLSAYIGGAHDYRQSLRDCHTPITVMVGMKSPLYAPVGQMAIADYARQMCKIVPFHRSGHIPLIDEPIKFTRELGRFLHDK